MYSNESEEDLKTMAGVFPQKILIVDDDPIQRMVLEQVFTGYTSVSVETAADGLEAISIIEHASEAFRLIILDLQLPNLDGVRLLSALAGRNYKGKILIISGMPPDTVRMSEVLAKAEGLNSIGHIMKPICIQELAAKIESEFGRNFFSAGLTTEKSVQARPLST